MKRLILLLGTAACVVAQTPPLLRVPSGSPNQVLATPDGASGPVALRSLVPGDVPSLAAGHFIVDGRGVCAANNNTQLDVCLKNRAFTYSGTAVDNIASSDCGNSVTYSLGNGQTAPTSIAIGLPSPSIGGFANGCPILVVNQTPSFLNISVSNLAKISGDSALVIPPAKTIDNPKFAMIISDGTNWNVAQNNLYSPVQLQINGTDAVVQTKVNLKQGSGAISITDGGDGGITFNSLSSYFNNVLNPVQTRLNVYAGQNITLIPDGIGGVKISSTSPTGGALTAGHGLGFGAYSAIPSTCSVGDVFQLISSAYDYAGCSSTNTWTVFADSVPLTTPAALGATAVNYTGDYNHPLIVTAPSTDLSQGYEVFSAPPVSTSRGSGGYVSWAAPTTTPYTKYVFIEAPYFVSMDSYSFWTAGFEDAQGKRITFDCGEGQAIYSGFYCALANYDQNGVLGTLSSFAFPQQGASRSGRTIIGLRNDGTNLTWSLCGQVGVCTDMASISIANSTLADQHKLIVGLSNSTTYSPTLSMYFLGVY